MSVQSVGEEVVETDLPNSTGFIEYSVRGLYDWIRLDSRGNRESSNFLTAPYKQMVLGPDLHLWYIRYVDHVGAYRNSVASMTLTGSEGDGRSSPNHRADEDIIADLAVGVDEDSIWYTCHRTKRVISHSGVVSKPLYERTRTEYPLTRHPRGITGGPDGAMWFTMFSHDRISPWGADIILDHAIGRIKDGVVTAFRLTDKIGGVAPGIIVPGIDCLFFLGDPSFFDSGIYRMRLDGTVDVFYNPRGARITALTVKDGALWFGGDGDPRFNREAGIGRIPLRGTDPIKIYRYSFRHSDGRIEYGPVGEVTGLVVGENGLVFYSGHRHHVTIMQTRLMESLGPLETITRDGKTIQVFQGPPLAFQTRSLPYRSRWRENLISEYKYRYPKPVGLLMAPSGETQNVWVLEEAFDKIARLPIGPYDGPIGFTLTIEHAYDKLHPLDGSPLVNVALAKFHDTRNRTADYYSATISWGDGTAIDSGKIVPRAGPPQTFNIVGSHAFDWSKSTMNAGGRPIYMVQVNLQATDGRKAQLGPFPVGGPLRIRIITEYLDVTSGEPFVNAKVAAFTDSQPGTTAADYVVLIYWKDGSPSSTGTVVASSVPQTFDILASHAFSTWFKNPPGIVQVTPKGGLTTGCSLHFTWPFLTVTAFPLTVNTYFMPETEIGSFTDTLRSPRGPYSALIAWGDGTTSYGTVDGNSIRAPSRLFGEQTTLTYTITVTAADGRQEVGENQIQIYLPDPDPNPNPEIL